MSDRNIIADITVDLPDAGPYTHQQRFLLRADGLVVRYTRYGNTPWSTRPKSTVVGKASKAVLANVETFADYVHTRKGWVGTGFTT